MELLKELLTVLSLEMTKPEPYGTYHLLTTAAFIIIGVLLCVFLKEGTEKQVRWVLFVTVTLTVLGEIYKQIVYTFSVSEGVIVADFQWYAFPFQFCSTPMYVGLLALLTRGRVHQACCDYLGTFAPFAGICVLAYPVDIYISMIGINIQTMVCHGSMIAVGMYLLYVNYVKCHLRTLRRAACVFAVAVALAAVMNEIAYRTGLLENETFNMFFISPYCEPSLPVYSSVQAVVPFPWSLVIYVAAFTLAAGLILAVAYGVKTVGRLCKKEK